LALVCGACAGSSGPAPEKPVKEETVADLDQREAREEVMEAEQARKTAAFQARLARLRSEEERRFRERGPTPTPPEAPQSVVEMAAELSALAAAGREGEVPASGRQAVPPSPTRSEDPTPEQWLRASRCLLTAEEAQVRDHLQRRRGLDRGLRAEWALAMVDVQQLGDEVQSEIEHRGLSDGDPQCTAEGSVQALLRSLWGPGAQTQGAPAVVAGVQRLRAELERRAGLPRRPESVHDPR
jgi:hypothetical protein